MTRRRGVREVGVGVFALLTEQAGLKGDGPPGRYLMYTNRCMFP